MTPVPKFWPVPLLTFFLLLSTCTLAAQETPQKPAPDAPEKSSPSDHPQLPFQIQLLETHIRFEANGDSRKEVHTIVTLNNILGAREFARVAFDYNRAFQQVEIPFVRIRHANGGTSELLPSAITDVPNPAVEKFPAYQDVRVKSVRILGLQEGDTLEYRVITTTHHPPLAPDFWLEHTFDRSGQVLQEIYELSVPGKIKPVIAPNAPPPSITAGLDRQSSYQWTLSGLKGKGGTEELPARVPDIQLTTFANWKQLSFKLAGSLQPPRASDGGWTVSPDVRAKSLELTKDLPACSAKLRAVYDYVSQSIATVDLPLASTRFHTRADSEILSSGYATPEDKYKLFAALSQPFSSPPLADLASESDSAEDQLPRPSLFNHLLLSTFCEGADSRDCCSPSYWLDPSMEVAPFGVVASNLRGKRVLSLSDLTPDDLSVTPWASVTRDLPFPSRQKVDVDAALNQNGELSAKVKYTLRGDNELLLRVAFHQTPKEKWTDVATLLAISDGFRGQITSIKASDPKATKDPFTVEYEITQPKFVDWNKKTVRIPALLPQIGLPDPPARNATGPNAPKIELGTPLDVDTRLTLRLPQGTTVQAPIGTSVQRDYATFSSQYSAKLNILSASRRVNFLARELPPDRASDFNAFLRTVQNDQSQLFTLTPASQQPAKPATPPPQKQKSSP